MVEVLLPTAVWHTRNSGRIYDAATETFRLPCGLVIPMRNVTTPGSDGWDGVSYVIRFDEEKEAAWFVLAVGGKIYNG